MSQESDIAPGIYIFTGRTHPERQGWGIDPSYETTVLHHDGTKSRMRIYLFASQVTVTVETDSKDSVLDMKNRVSRQVLNLVESLGHVVGAAIDVEILTCVTPSGEHWVFNTSFDGLIDNPSESEIGKRVFNSLIRQAGRSQYVRMALSDLRNAIREPLDTFANCYRAIESIRQEYLDGDSRDSSTRKRSWLRLREATETEEADLRWLEDWATPRRHGAPVDSSHEDRKRALRMARHVVEKYCLAIADAEQSTGDAISESPNNPDGEDR